MPWHIAYIRVYFWKVKYKLTLDKTLLSTDNRIEMKQPPHILEMRKQAARRRAEIRKLRSQKWTLQAIGNRFGIGRERVRQLLKRED